MTDVRHTLILARMEEARATLRTAADLFAAGRDHRSVVNRAYYAAFYCLLAVLQYHAVAPRSHQSALQLFDRECVRSGLLDAACSQAARRLFELRQEDDYRRIEPVLAEDGQMALQLAHLVYQQTRAYLLTQNLGPIPLPEAAP